jgi:hypothetical protein
MSLSLVSAVCCQVEVSASGSSLVQRSPTECDVSECDLETSKSRRPNARFALLRHRKGKDALFQASTAL